MPSGLSIIHSEVYANVCSGDPTPFKPFRRLEYANTIQSMGCLADTTDITTMLQDEIVITREVQQAALLWKSQGTLVFGLSDKPDEASLPTPELAAQGWLPLHHQPTHIVGV